MTEGNLFVAGGNKNQLLEGYRPDATFRLGERHVDAGPEHVLPTLVPVGDGDGQRRDADHLRRPADTRGPSE